MSAATMQQSRRNFLSGGYLDPGAIRPPGAVSAYDFHDLCSQCGDCSSACPENIIRRGSDGFPTVDFSRGACTFCEACIEACDTGALTLDIAWPHRAAVSRDCLSMNAVQCRICQDQCDQQAIRFQLIAGGKAMPQISLDDCIGCGGCVASCPVSAIAIETPNEITESQTC